MIGSTAITTMAGAHRPTVRWVVGIFAATILLQRFSLPGGIVPLLLVVVFAACAYGSAKGLMVFDRRRLNLYLLAAALTALIALPQGMFVTNPLISLTSWGLFLTVWAPATVVLVFRNRGTLLAALSGCFKWGLALAVACIVMRLVQVLGVPYTDPLKLIIPPGFLVQGYVITYPIEYGSQIYRSNAWIGLEPSIISLQLGVTLLLGLLLRRPVWLLALIAVGMTTTASGSGFFVAAVGVIVMLLTPVRRLLWRYVAAGLAAAVLAVQTPSGQAIAQRATESTIRGSSTSLRAIEPYLFLWPQLTEQVTTVLLGLGAGSSQKLVDATNRAGLLIPSPVKVFFDYGIVAGMALAVFLLYCYFNGPSLTLSIPLFFSSWVLQPGTTTFVLVVPTLIFITWWAPTPSRRIELEPVTRHEMHASPGEVPV